MDKHDEQGLKELEQYLLEWVYEYGTPFTEIRYVFDSCEPLEVIENAQNRALYEQAYPHHDEPLYDANGKFVGIQTVLNREKEREQKPLAEMIKDRLYEQLIQKNHEIAEIMNTLQQFE
ncbi:MAG: hypothetical protein LUI12_05090 [Clostridiales bacterium]|nr:hypothetical protein [Clostridiales bacterium]